MSSSIQTRFRMNDGTSHEVSLSFDKNTTIQNVKTELEKQYGIPANGQDLYLNNRIIQPLQTLNEIGYDASKVLIVHLRKGVNLSGTPTTGTGPNQVGSPQAPQENKTESSQKQLLRERSSSMNETKSTGNYDNFYVQRPAYFANFPPHQGWQGQGFAPNFSTPSMRFSKEVSYPQFLSPQGFVPKNPANQTGSMFPNQQNPNFRPPSMTGPGPYHSSNPSNTFQNPNAQPNFNPNNHQNPNPSNTFQNPNAQPNFNPNNHQNPNPSNTFQNPNAQPNFNPNNNQNSNPPNAFQNPKAQPNLNPNYQHTTPNNVQKPTDTQTKTSPPPKPETVNKEKNDFPAPPAPSSNQTVIRRNSVSGPPQQQVGPENHLPSVKPEPSKTAKPENPWAQAQSNQQKDLFLDFSGFSLNTDTVGSNSLNPWTDPPKTESKPKDEPKASTPTQSKNPWDQPSNKKDEPKPKDEPKVLTPTQSKNPWNQPSNKKDEPKPKEEPKVLTPTQSKNPWNQPSNKKDEPKPKEEPKAKKDEPKSPWGQNEQPKPINPVIEPPSSKPIAKPRGHRNTSPRDHRSTSTLDSNHNDSKSSLKNANMVPPNSKTSFEADFDREFENWPSTNWSNSSDVKGEESKQSQDRGTKALKEFGDFLSTFNKPIFQAPSRVFTSDFESSSENTSREQFALGPDLWKEEEPSKPNPFAQEESPSFSPTFDFASSEVFAAPSPFSQKTFNPRASFNLNALTESTTFNLSASSSFLVSNKEEPKHETTSPKAPEPVFEPHVTAEKCTAEGTGLKSSVAGLESSFIITSRDQNGNEMSKGGEKFTALLHGPDLIQATVEDLKNGKYKITYTATIKGLYDLFVGVNDLQIQNSPFPCLVAAGPTSPAKCVATGVFRFSVGTPAVFFLQSRDQFGNNRAHGHDRVDISLDGPQRCQAKITDANTGTYTVTIDDLTLAGIYEVKCIVNGQSIMGSPFKALVEAGEISPAECIASGAGLEGGQQDSECKFLIKGSDAYGNSKKFSHLNDLKCWLEKDSRKFFDCDSHIDSKTGAFQVCYVLRDPGFYKLHVTIAGEPINESPFKVHIQPNTSKEVTPSPSPVPRKSLRANFSTSKLHTLTAQDKKVVICQSIARGFLARKKLKKLREFAHHRSEIAYEIMETEEAYVNCLTILESIYISPLKNCKPPLIDQDALGIIFSNVDFILPLNQVLLTKLKQRLGYWTTRSSLADLFVEAAPSFQYAYTAYIQNYDHGLKTLTHYEQKSSVAAFIEKQKKLPQAHQLDIASILIMPVQRLPRYELLLKELLKYTDPESKDHTQLNLALEKIKSITTFVNDNKRRVENAEKIRIVQEKVPDPRVKTLFQGTQRIYVTEATFNVTFGKKTKHRHLFLFNDIILIAKVPKLSSRMKYDAVFKLSNFLTLKELNEKTLEINSTTDASKLILSCQDSRLITVWFGYLKTIIKNLSAPSPAVDEKALEQHIENAEKFLKGLKHQ